MINQEKKTNLLIGACLGGALTCFLTLFIQWWPSSVETQELTAGTGDQIAAEGKQVVFHYEAFLRDPSQKDELGLKWDSTYERHQPMVAILGSKQVIPGLEEALAGMKVGAKRIARIPSSKAYGKLGAAGGLIPPGADLIYRLEVKSITVH